METPIIAVHLVYAQNMFPAHEKVVYGRGVLVPALLEETWCVKCIRQAWHLTPEEGDADLVKAARHLTKEAHLAARVDLLEEDMIEPAEFHCNHCGASLVQGKKDPIRKTTIPAMNLNELEMAELVVILNVSLHDAEALKQRSQDIQEIDAYDEHQELLRKWITRLSRQQSENDRARKG